MSSTTQSAPSWQHGKVAGWIVSVDHKRIGALYLGWAGVFFVIAGDPDGADAAADDAAERVRSSATAPTRAC